MKRSVIGCGKHQDKIGVLLAQLGTPEAPTKEALKPYLKQFLSDPRVVEVNRLLWWFLLRFVILRKRPARSAELYKRIWTEEGSPLLLSTQRQAKGVKERLEKELPNIEVAVGMRYGTPSLAQGIDELLAKGCTKLLLFPMYPQYSGATTGSTYDAVFAHLLTKRFVPTLRVVEPYYAHPQYIHAQAYIINEALATCEEPPDRLLLSYHGIPVSYVEKGDPYCCMCSETTRALLPHLSISSDKVFQTFQSRFGKEPWLEPYTDITMERLPKQGVQHVAVSCPGFVADCLETIDEIGVEAKEIFEAHGGKKLTLVPCLNEHPVWIEAMKGIILEELGSWLQTSRRNDASRDSFVCPTAPTTNER